MDCSKCTLKGCRNGSPCKDGSEDYLENYLSATNHDYVRAASQLIDNGRAGTLNRLEEIVEYSKLRGYKKLGVAYCYGLERYAALLRNYLERYGFQPVLVSCIVDSLRENQLDPEKTSASVSCNPIGQAYVLNSSGAELTLLIGLCLGHDILIQKNFKMDFTTFVVKDRVFSHNPLEALKVIQNPG
jgi:uncharacterized metal-binding protein